MKIFISADMEGISGVTHREHLVEGNHNYERAKKLMTQEVNAAVEGALEAGADEILVSDSHGSMRNILIEELNPRATLISGYPKPFLMMEGIDSSYDGAMFVGYHSKASTAGVMAHTISGFTFSSISVNGVEYGETAINAAIAGCYNVPVLMVTGDNILKEEVKSILPAAEFAQVKTARGRLSAECLTPSVAYELIKSKAKEAVINRNNVESLVVKGAVKLEIVLNNPAIADVIAIIPEVERISPLKVRYEAPDFMMASRMLTTMMNAACVLMMDAYK